MSGITLKLPAAPKAEGGKVPRSSTERLWLIGGGLVAFVLLLIGYFFFISPQRAQTSDVDSQVATAQQQNSKLKARLNDLQEQNKNLAKYAADLGRARLALPATSGVPDFLRSLQALGSATHANVTSVTFGHPAPRRRGSAQHTVRAPARRTRRPPPPQRRRSRATASPASSVLQIPINASVTGSIGALETFLDQLQTVQPRAVLITQIAESTGVTSGNGAAASGNATLQLTMEAFVSPAAAAATTAAPSAGSH